MKKGLKMALDAIEKAGFILHEYAENGRVCGYECETWTEHAGINMLMFIDLRGTERPTAQDVAREVAAEWENFDADRETLEHVAAWPELLKLYGLSRLLEDFEEYENTLDDLSAALHKIAA